MVKAFSPHLGVHMEISYILEPPQVPEHRNLFSRSCFSKEKSWFPGFVLDTRILSWGGEGDEPQDLFR